MLAFKKTLLASLQAHLPPSGGVEDDETMPLQQRQRVDGAPETDELRRRRHVSGSFQVRATRTTTSGAESGFSAILYEPVSNTSLTSTSASASQQVLRFRRSTEPHVTSFPQVQASTSSTPLPHGPLRRQSQQTGTVTYDRRHHAFVQLQTVQETSIHSQNPATGGGAVKFADMRVDQTTKFQETRHPCMYSGESFCRFERLWLAEMVFIILCLYVSDEVCAITSCTSGARLDAKACKCVAGDFLSSLCCLSFSLALWL